MAQRWIWTIHSQCSIQNPYSHYFESFSHIRNRTYICILNVWTLRNWNDKLGLAQHVSGTFSFCEWDTEANKHTIWNLFDSLMSLPHVCSWTDLGTWNIHFSLSQVPVETHSQIRLFVLPLQPLVNMQSPPSPDISAVIRLLSSAALFHGLLSSVPVADNKLWNCHFQMETFNISNRPCILFERKV